MNYKTKSGDGGDLTPEPEVVKAVQAEIKKLGDSIGGQKTNYEELSRTRFTQIRDLENDHYIYEDRHIDQMSECKWMWYKTVKPRTIRDRLEREKATNIQRFMYLFYQSRPVSERLLPRKSLFGGTYIFNQSLIMLILYGNTTTTTFLYS